MKYSIRHIRTLAALIVFAAGTAAAADSEVVARLDRLFREHKAKIASPGISVTVVDRDGVIFQRGYGVVTYGQPEQMTERTRNAIGSLTKSFTALAIMQLEEQGLLSVDDPVIKYLPWFRAADKDLSDTITLRMCLNNTSGLVPSWNVLVRNLSREPDALEKSVRAMSSYRFARAPGESYEYFNEGWNTLGLIIEKLTGRRWEHYLAEEILAPLQMTGSSSDREVLEGWPTGTGHFAGMTPVPAPLIHIQGSLPAGSGLYCTSEDIGKYLIALLNGGVFGGTRVISEASVEEMWKPAIQLRVLPYELGGTGEPSHYGMGWFLMEVDGLSLVGHGGQMRTMSSFAMLDPEHGVAAAVLYNTGMLEAYTNQSSFHVVNNAVRIAQGLPLSNFGIPREEDPTLNDFSPDPTLVVALLGVYLTDSGNRLDLEPGGSEGLRAYLANGIYSPNFDVDFINDTNFVLRNFAEGLRGTYVGDREGAVSSLTIAGESYRKKPASRNDNLRAFESTGLGLSFSLPKSWTLDWVDKGFTAHGDDRSGLVLGGGPSAMTYHEWLASMDRRPDGQTSFVLSELRNGYYLQSVMSRSLQNGTDIQTLSIFCDHRGTRYVFFLQTPDGDLTNAVISALNPFLDSLSLR
jgi:CubicO group peptidase (beta-lactamase class C family)